MKKELKDLIKKSLYPEVCYDHWEIDLILMQNAADDIIGTLLRQFKSHFLKEYGKRGFDVLYLRDLQDIYEKYVFTKKVLKRMRKHFNHLWIAHTGKSPFFTHGFIDNKLRNNEFKSFILLKNYLNGFMLSGGHICLIYIINNFNEIDERMLKHALIRISIHKNKAMKIQTLSEEYYYELTQ